MKFTNIQLQQCYERNFVQISGLSDALRQICALISVYDFFKMLEGPDSSRVHEAIEFLTSANLRPALRQWYERGAILTVAEMSLRDQLSQLTGEQLEKSRDGSGNPS